MWMITVLAVELCWCWFIFHFPFSIFHYIKCLTIFVVSYILLDFSFATMGVPDIAFTMIGIFGAILAGLFGISLFLDVRAEGNWLPTTNNLAKRQFEIFAVAYSVVWISVFGYVVAFGVWRSFDEVRLTCPCQ